MADKHAKAAAAAARHPSDAVKMIQKTKVEAANLAAWIARATFAANNGKDEPRRDTTGTRRFSGRTKKTKEKQRERGIQRRPTQLGGHELEMIGTQWRCKRCNKESAQLRRIAPSLCGGSAALHWARRASALKQCGGTDGAGHLRAGYGRLTWCVRCGSYAERWAVGLAAPCRGQPTNQSQKRVLRRLWDGRHPRTNARFTQELVMEASEVCKHAGLERGAREQGEGTSGGICGQELPRGTAGYLRRPGGAASAFESRHGGCGSEEQQDDFNSAHRARVRDLNERSEMEAKFREVISSSMEAVAAGEMAAGDGRMLPHEQDSDGNDQGTMSRKQLLRRLLRL